MKTESDPKIFNRSFIEEGPSIAISFLVDRSRSTEGTVAQNITLSSMGIVQALEAFPEVSTSISHFPAASNRSDPPALSVTKSFNTRLVRCVKSWPSASGNTPLAQALMQATSDLLVVRRERKIICVITDGKPSDVAAAVRAKSFVSGIGVEVLGVVVSEKSYPLEVFDHSTSISCASDLPAALRDLVLRSI